MDLRDNNITVGELLEISKARAILRREFPQFANPLTLVLARKMRLSEVLNLADGRVAPEKVRAALDELRAV